MNAIISGRAGLAVVREGTSTRTFVIDAEGWVSERNIAFPERLLHDVDDVELLSGATPRQVEDSLVRARQREDALHVTLVLLDGRTSPDLRQEAAQVLEELLNTQATQASLERVLYAAPLPSSADASGAAATCEATSSNKARAMILKLRERQPYIDDVRVRWDQMADAFPTKDEFHDFQTTLVWEGMFRELVETLATGESLDRFFFTILSDNRVKEHRNHRAIVQRWMDNWAVESPDDVVPPTDTADEERTRDEYSDEQRSTPRLKADEALGRIKRQKAFIIRAMRNHRTANARQYISELIEFHETASDTQRTRHICMSLCSLAAEAKALGLYDLQLELVERALAYKADDEVALDQRADALKMLNRLPEALQAYRESVAQHPENVVGKNGYAEVLKALNRLPEALQAYQEAMVQHPENVVTKSGYAEVLKALNRLPEALQTYHEAMDQHPASVVPKAGYAEVLKALNRLPDALQAYQETVDQHPEDVVAKNGYAEVLKALNQLPEALQAYQQAMDQHPEDVVAKTGYAGVLKALNRLPEALEAYREAMVQHPEDVVPKAGYAEVLKALNRLPEALEAYQEAVAQHPENMVARCGASGVLAVLERWDDALAMLPQTEPVTEDDWVGYHIRGMIHLRRGEIDKAIKIFRHGVENDPRPSSAEYFRTALALAHLREKEYKVAASVLEQVTSPAFQTRANVLRLHAFGAQGECERTIQIYEQLPKEPEPILAELQEELHQRYVLFRSPQHDEQWVYDREVQYFLLAA